MSVKPSGADLLRVAPPPVLSLVSPPRSMELAKAAAYIAGQAMGQRRAYEDALLENISNPDRRARLVNRVRAASTDEAALSILREALRVEESEIERELLASQKEADALKRRADALKEMVAWGSGPLVLGAAPESLFHRVVAGSVLGFSPCGEWMPPEIEQAQREVPGVFLVQHDWASLLDKGDVDEGGVRLPFESCCFEFQVSGRRVCVLVRSDDDGPYRMIPVVQAGAIWAVFCSFDLRSGTPVIEVGNDDEPFGEMLYAQIRAIAITLDAEVVESEVVRAPHKLNESRTKRGAPPLYDHHILRLVRRNRPAALRGEATGYRKRLHFRRGHWRHYSGFKTWIRWCLVGDPTLGFADKDYRL